MSVIVSVDQAFILDVIDEMYNFKLHKIILIACTCTIHCKVKNIILHMYDRYRNCIHVKIIIAVTFLVQSHYSSQLLIGDHSIVVTDVQSTCLVGYDVLRALKTRAITVTDIS